MTTVVAYLYPISIEVQILDPNIFSTRNRVVYNRPLTVYRGIDNLIQIQFKNQDQKAVEMVSYQVRADLQDPTSQTSVANFELTYIDEALGYGTIVIPSSTLNNCDQRYYQLVLRAINETDSSETPIYTDPNYGLAIDVQVLDGYFA